MSRITTELAHERPTPDVIISVAESGSIVATDTGAVVIDKRCRRVIHAQLHDSDGLDSRSQCPSYLKGDMIPTNQYVTGEISVSLHH